jgi:hypothetical protein
MKLTSLIFIYILFNSVLAQTNLFTNALDSIPADLPLPIITISNEPSSGYIFASVPYWGNGNHYLVIYNNHGKPVFYRKTKSLCTDFKLHENRLLTYYDYAAKKYYAMDSAMIVVDSFWVQNGYTTDEHDIKFLKNGNVLLIGLNIKNVDMSKFVDGGNKSASVVTNVIQEITPEKNVVFEWKSDEHYKFTDAANRINLLDVSFVHSHINSIEIDDDENIIVSARNLNEITKIDRVTGNIIWRLGGKNNQFNFVNDSVGFSAQHSATTLKNGNLLIYDNGLEYYPQSARAIEYKLDQKEKTATVIWSYKNQPDIVSNFWGNVQRLENGNTFVSWGFNKIGATELNTNDEKVFEIEFPQDVYSYRIFKYDIKVDQIVTVKEFNEAKEFTLLEQNYPNPFNPVTTIKYSVPISVRGEIQEVKLIIYDLLGRLVSIVVDENKYPGNYEVKFDGSNISSGIYIYKIIVGKYNSAKKFVLIK